jgi:TP901 family phage tail tape measure protein|nr:MAG TPA: minor tail protein [Caudoviricetes sp.]
MAEEFKVKVGVEVDTAGLDAQIAKIKPSNKIKCDVELNDASVQHIVDQLNNGIKAFGKNGNEIKFTADVTGLKKDVASAVKGVTGKSAANNIKVNADTSAAQNKISNLNNVVENGKVNFEQFKKVMQSSQFAKFDLNDEEIKAMAKSLNDLGITIKGLDIDFKDDHTLNFKATGIDELKQDVKDVVTYARQADEAMEEIAPKGSVKVYKDNSAKEAAAAAKQAAAEEAAAVKQAKAEEAAAAKQAAAQAKAAAQEQAAAEKQVAEAARQAAKEQAAAAQIAANAATQRQKLIDTYKAEKQSKVDVDSKYNKINNPSEDLTKAYNAYKNAKKNLFDTENFADNVVAVNQYNAALETVKNQLSIVANKERDAATAAKAEASAQKEAAAAMQLRSKANNLSMSMDAWLKRNSAAAKTFGGQIRSLQAELKSCDATRFSGIQSEFKTITTQAEIIGKTGLSMGDRLKMQFTKLSSYFGAASVIMTGVQAVKEGFQNVLDVDTKLTELYRVTDFTSSQYSDVYDTLTTSAQKYGATLTDLISQTADWSRAGFSDPDTAARLSEITSVYQHIADLDAKTSMENLLTAYKGFEPQLKKQFGGDAAAAAEHIADVYNEIDNNYATTAADIGEAVKRSASALSLAGNSLEETAGMVTGITEVTQDPEKAGNSLKVLSMRLRGMKGELQDLGEETDENVENLSQMQGKVLNLTHGKVNIFDNTGDFKSTYEIMQGIADIYDDLTDSDKADLLETIAGKNRANEVAALIQNWDRVAQATESAENSAGSAMAEQEKYANSLQGRLNSLTSSLQTISNTALDSGFLKGLVSGATEAINILNKVIDTIGIIPTVATVAGAAMSLSGKKFFDFHIDEQTGELKAFGKTAQTIFSSIKNAFSGIGQIVGEVFNKINSKSQNGGQVFDFNSVKIDGSYGGMRFVKNLDNDIAKLKEFKTLMSKMQSELKDGMSIDVNDVIKQSMSGASEAAKNFAKSWDLSNEALGEFSKKQLEATGVISKTSNSMTNAKNIISAYNNLVDKSGETQSKFASAISTFNPQLGNYLSGLKSGEASLGGYGVQLAFATVKTFALQAATLALNAALSMGISMLISAGVSALMSWINRADELADKVKDVTTEYNNQKKELKDTKATINEVADSYAELSKGVDTSTNENINLDTDEYQQYLDIVNQIGDTFPNLISGYDAQGNAILTCAGNVDKLTEAYNKLAKANNDKILNNADDITEDFKNKSKDIFNDDKWKKNSVTGADNRYRIYKRFKDLTKSKDIDKAVDGLSAASLVGVTDLLGAYGEKYDENGKETKQEFISRTIKENEDVVNEIITGTEASLKEASSGMVDVAEAALSNAFISGKYKNISSKMQDYINGITSNMDYEFFNNDRIKGSADNLEDYIDDMLNTINSLDDGQQKKFEIFFDMKSKLNNGDCTVGEYVNSVNDVKNVIKNSGLDEDMQYQLQMSLGIKDDDTVKQVKDFKKKLTDAGKSEDVANEIVNGLTKTELEAAVSLKLKLKDMNVNDIKKAIADEAKYLEAMDFDIDIAGETDSLDKLNSALAESKSATGLTADSIDALKSRYQGLKGAGYDAAKLFEETSNGVRLNTQEYTKLEQAYAQGKLKDATSNLKYLRDKYNDLTGQIATCTDAEERANLVSKQEDIRQKINDLGELAAQYEGLASKYNAWQNAESAGSDRDMYENVLKGFEEVDDELSRGWLDDASKAFIDMFSYDQLNSIDDYTNRWKTLGNTIDGTTYSVKDFFTQNKDGESTNDGVYNFLEAVDQLGQGNIKRGENGEIISFDFGVNGEEAIAKTMGISKELVQIIERAAEDAGFVINMDGTYTNFADLQKAAVESNKKINELAQSSEKLKKLGLDNYTFHFDSTDAETVFNDLNKAKEMLDTFRRDDGTIDLSVDGAQDALNIASTLQAAYDKLADPVYMQLDASQVDDSMKKPLQLMQEYRTQQKKLNQMKLQGVDTSEVDKSMSDIVDKIAKLDDDTKVKLGIDVDASKEDIKKQLDSGDLTIDATVDLQVEANDTLNDIKLLMEHQAGLITDDQLKIGLELDTSSVDDYTKKEATKIVKFLPENTDFLDNLGLDDDKKKVVVDFVSDNADFLNGLDLKDGKKEILLKYVAENPDLLKDLDDDKKKIAIDFVVNNQDILDKLDDEKQRKVVVDFVAKNEGVLDDVKTDEEKEVVVNFIANNEDVLNGLDDEKQRKVIIDFVAENPNFFDSLGLNDDEKKVAIEFVAKNQDLLKDLSYEKKQVVVDFVAKNADFFDKLDDDKKTIAIDFVANNQDFLKDLSDEDKQVVVDYIVKNPDALDGLSNEDKQVKINAIVSGEEGINQISSDINGLSDKQVKVIAQTLGNIDVENLKSAIANLSDKQVQAIATAMGKGDVDGLKSALDGMSDKQVQAVATALGFSDVESLKSAVAGLDGKQVQAVAQALGISDVDSLRSAVNGLNGKTVEAVANAIGAGNVTSLQGVIDSLKGKTVNVVANLIGSAASFLSGGSKVNGTAHVNGTAFANGTTGKAFKNGNWGAKEDGAALMGELGQEIVVRNGRWFTVGDNGAEFVGYKKGDIVFNHKQSEELLRNGYVTSGGGRGRALASGTAFGRGSGGIGRANKGSSVKTSSSSSSSSKSSSSSSSNSNSNSSANEEAEKFEETLDWIETALDRVERAISRLDKTATSTYKNWTKRGTALNDQISQTRREIDLQNQAYNRYIQQANSVGLDAGYAAKVRDGTIDIEKITDEDLNNKISEYKQWYEKALDCLDAIDDLRESESKLYEQRFENVSTKYDGYLGVIQHEKDMLDEFVSQTETAGYITSGKYYDAMSANAKKQQEELKKQRDEMISELNNAVNSGTIEKYSESWYSMVNSVDEVTKSIEECNTSLLEYEKNLRELDWQIFDLIQDKISKVADESEFLINLMSNKKLYEDNGQLTDEGMATMGQYGVEYNVYMAQANKYAKKIKELQADLAKDPYNQDIANQLQEYIEAQQEAILNAEDMKNSIKDMVSDGIDKELDSLQKLIDKRNDALDAAKDLYDYQKKIKESTKDIADLEKQMAAYQGDVSEETKAKVQQIKVDLEEAKSDLEETEYEQYISDQQKMLDDLYNDYETILNQRLDDIDALMADMISEINNNASTIGATIESQADKVGYTLSESMNTIWLSGNGSISSVITMYGTKFDTALTTTNTALGYINTNIQNMITQLNKIAGTKIKAAGVSSAATEKPTPKPSSTPTQQQQQQQQKKQVTVGGTINAGGARIYADSYGNGGGRQTFGSDPIYTVLQERNGYILTRWHKLSSGYTGWFKKSDVSAYALGAKNIRNNEMAWTQENGSEMIMRPSDGAILTPLAKNDSVLTSAASSNIWNMANNPSDFIKDNLDLDKIDTGANVGNKTTYTQNLDKVVFNLPNVKNYDELLKSMQHDKNFERLIMSMTIDPIAGKSSLAKGKAIR